MTTPVIIMIVGGVSGLLAGISVIYNFVFSVSRDMSVSSLVRHIVFGIWANASWVAFLVGLVMFIIQWAKHA